MWSDKETIEDCLGFSYYVQVLSDLSLEKNMAPLTIGIFGDWGSGKSSLMKMVQSKIKSENPENVVTVWFNAWQYEGKDEIQSALIHSVLKTLENEKTFTEQAKTLLSNLKSNASVMKLAKFITKTTLTMTPDIGGLLDCFKDESEKLSETMEQFNDNYEKLLQELKISRVVVFIDDLDRCIPARVMETFETVKLFLHSPQSTFIIGAAKSKIEFAISEVYGWNKSEASDPVKDYLEKIIHIPFSIPKQNEPDIVSYINMLVLSLFLPNELWAKLLGERISIVEDGGDLNRKFIEWVNGQPQEKLEQKKPVIDALTELHPYMSILINGLKGNPRQLKRFLNILELRERLAKINKIDIDKNILIKLLVIEYTWEKFFKNVIDTCDPETGASELLKRIDAYSKKGKAEDLEKSEMLKSAVESIGVVKFLESEPKIDESVDLRPYLFLAQTALTPTSKRVYSPPDESANSIVAGVASQDDIKSMAFTKQAVKQPQEILDGIVPKLRAILISSKEADVRVNTLVGLREVCKSKPEYYSQVVDTISEIDPSENEGVSLVASGVLDDASNHGIEVDETLKNKFGEASPLIKALKKRVK